MSRRPKFLPGNLYLVKDIMAWDFDKYFLNPTTKKHCTRYYIGQLKEIGKIAELNKKFNMKIQLGFYLDIQVLASNFKGTIINHTHRLFFDRQIKCRGSNYFINNYSQYSQYVIQKFNPENLPLYIHWYWNEWILERLHHDTLSGNDCSPAPASPSLH